MIALASVPYSFPQAGMRRLSRSEIETLFVVTLATAPVLTLRYFRSMKRLEREKGRDELAALLASKVDGDSVMVIVTDQVGESNHSRPGKWGVHEPAPV